MSENSEARRIAPKMLIADDDPSIVRLLAERCTNMGFEVETASNGIQALFRANRSKPDVVVIDVNMPKANGLSVCAHLLEPAKKSFDVVVVTGNRDSETIDRCAGLGAFYAHKGPNFWNNLATALAQIFPRMAEQIKNEEAKSSGAEVRKRPCVLLVDDDIEMEKFLSSRLGKYGVDLLYAADGAQGFRMACKEEPSVIISDYLMQKGDALYLLWKLRSTPVTENIPVFILSGRRLDDSAKQTLAREICGRPGATGFFRKSFDTGELFEALQQHCGFETNLVEA